MMGELDDLVLRPEFWLILGVGLYVIETMFDTFYLGGAAIGALLAAAGVWLVPEVSAGGGGMQVGLPVMMWGGGTLIGCALTRYFWGHRKTPPDISERPYSGDPDDDRNDDDDDLTAR